jgi:hypothetical protein
MSTNQEYWDACLIRAWRKNIRVQDALDMFVSITGKRPSEFELKRIPKDGSRTYVPMRYFVAQRLERISEWLLKCGPEYDKELLRKLSASRLDVSAHCMNLDRGRQEAIKETIENGKRIEFTLKQIHIDRENAARFASLVHGNKSLKKATVGAQ